MVCPCTCTRSLRVWSTPPSPRFVPSVVRSKMLVPIVKRHARSAMTRAPACAASSMALAKNASIRSARKEKRGSREALTRSAMERVAQLQQPKANLTRPPRQPWVYHLPEYLRLATRRRLRLSWAQWVTRFRSMDNTLPSQGCTSLERARLTLLTTCRCSQPRRLIRDRSTRVKDTLFPLPTNIIRRTFLMALCRTPLPILYRIIALICRLLCSLTLSTLGIRTATTPPTPSRHLPVIQALTSPSV
jgi:hypothetical protein